MVGDILVALVLFLLLCLLAAALEYRDRHLPRK